MRCPRSAAFILERREESSRVGDRPLRDERVAWRQIECRGRADVFSLRHCDETRIPFGYQRAFQPVDRITETFEPSLGKRAIRNRDAFLIQLSGGSLRSLVFVVEPFSYFVLILLNQNLYLLSSLFILSKHYKNIIEIFQCIKIIIIIS